MKTVAIGGVRASLLQNVGIRFQLQHDSPLSPSQVDDRSHPGELLVLAARCFLSASKIASISPNTNNAFKWVVKYTWSTTMVCEIKLFR